MTPDPFFDKGLPSEIEAERSILGAILLDHNVLDQAVALCPPETMFLDKHRRIYRAMIALAGIGQVIDPITLGSEMRRTEEFESVGGASYIASLIDGVPRNEYLKPYADLVMEAALKRRLISTCEGIIQRTFGDERFEEVILAAEEKVFSLSESRRLDQGPEHVSVIGGRLADFYEQKKLDPTKLIGLSTGFKDIDRMTLGLTPGITLLAARPRMGKTAMAVNISCNVAQAGGSVYFASVESSSEKIVQRVLASMSRIDSYRLRQGYMNKEEWARLAETLRNLIITRFVVDDTPDLAPDQLASRCRQHKAQYGLDLVVVDYLQLMARRLMLQRRYQDLRSAVQEVGAGMVEISRRLDVPVLALAQFNRDVDKRTDQRPQLSDLAESASLEQDADIVMALYREEVYKPDDPSNANLAKVFFLKQRDGAEGDIDLAFIRSYTRFEDLAWDAKPDTKQYKKARGSAWGRGNEEPNDD